jgi:CDP-diacylglycerol--glycerol-3-phosphate 3-phosphatidyltransferase
VNPAHFFTLLRIFLSPLFPLIYLARESLGISLVTLPYVLLPLLILSEFSDVFDGFIARRRNQVTDLGKVLDPMADSITRISLFLTFTQGFVQLPLMVVLVFLYRDFFITTLRTLCALRGIALAARFSGKLKAIIQACVAFLIIILMFPYTTGHMSLELFQRISLYAICFSAIYTVISAYDYLYSNRQYIRMALKPLK